MENFGEMSIIRTVKSVPLRLKKNLNNIEVRGMLHAKDSSFCKLEVKERRRKVAKPCFFANPRKLAAGGIAQLRC